MIEHEAAGRLSVAVEIVGQDRALLSRRGEYRLQGHIVVVHQQIVVPEQHGPAVRPASEADPLEQLAIKLAAQLQAACEAGDGFGPVQLIPGGRRIIAPVGVLPDRAFLDEFLKEARDARIGHCETLTEFAGGRQRLVHRGGTHQPEESFTETRSFRGDDFTHNAVNERFVGKSVEKQLEFGEAT